MLRYAAFRAFSANFVSLPDNLVGGTFDLGGARIEASRLLAGTLSGGERQMLATGRALMSDPKLLMLNEPSLGLAAAVVGSMYETLGRLRREGLTPLLAEQALEPALEVADFAYVLQTGRTMLKKPDAQLADGKDVQRDLLGAGAGRVRVG